MARREDEFIGFGSMKIWIGVLLGMALVSSIVFYTMDWFKNNQPLMKRVYADGCFVMGDNAPWGATSDDLYAKLRFATGDRDRVSDLLKIQKLSAPEKDGSFNIVPYETKKYRETELPLSTYYHMNPDKRLVSGVFYSEEEDYAVVLEEVTKIVKAVSALPVEAEASEDGILAELNREGFEKGEWTWRAGQTRFRLIVKSNMSTLYKSRRAGTVEIHILGPDAPED